MPPITVQDLKIIVTQPLTPHQRMIVVKLITSEPGLYGLGCATFTQSYHSVVAALEQHIKPFLIGRDVSRIEDIWQMAWVNAYWRNGPVLNNALSGVDIALWDIKGKLANMPVYQLLGGKCREAAAVYVHADGRNPQEVIDNARAFMDQGYRYVRLQMGGYGGKDARDVRPPSSPLGAYYDAREYTRRMVGMLEKARAALGAEMEILHDIHERLSPIDALNFAKAVEPLNLFFLEDALAPEDIEWFAHIRAQCATPLAMGELFNHPQEWRWLIERRLIDFLRMHISQIGGLTPARNAAIHGAIYGIRTAWHGPGDVSPVGHAANLHLDLWAPNFGIQEWCRFPEIVYEIFPGCPEVRDGYMFSNDKPGFGVDIDEALAAKYPPTDEVLQWTQTRLPDGSPARP
ncbi:MAG: starvation-sensing protein RspA [Anaerolineae bacterium]|nr:starvation-sensing protein RspA [Anaerolineae bacterium]NUQ06209.1 starvation-sensing protein RspA [Anaerolineae bacterium]